MVLINEEQFVLTFYCAIMSVSITSVIDLINPLMIEGKMKIGVWSFINI